MATEVAARLRGARISAQKARLVADQVRGLEVEKALNLLEFSPKTVSYTHLTLPTTPYV